LQGKKPLIVDESIAVDRIGSTESVAAAEAQTSSLPERKKPPVVSTGGLCRMVGATGIEPVTPPV
jgi:hypothetical protein